MLSNVSGVGGSLMRAQPKYVMRYPIPLPPLPEQQRIVERIESLFEKLDRAKELVQATLDSFETCKAAILHKAFTGELTAQWREENGVRMGSWEERELREVVENFRYGTSEKSDYANNGVPVIRIPNISDGYLDFSDIKYLSTDIIDNDNQLLPDVELNRWRGG
jgi:type I restriction enzyme S subunit